MTKEEIIDSIEMIFKNGFCSHFKIIFDKNGVLKKGLTGKNLNTCEEQTICKNCKESITNLKDLKKLITKHITANGLDKKRLIVVYLFDMYVKMYITKDIAEYIIETIFSLKEEDLNKI